MLTFAEFLAKRRAALGMSMTELAGRLSVTPQYISLLEGGRCNPSRKLQDRCARFFGEDPEFIRFLSQSMPRVQKEVLLRTPSALPFRVRQGRDPQVESESSWDSTQSDSEDRLLQALFQPIEDGEATGEREGFFGGLIREIQQRPDRFSAKAVAWADYYAARLLAERSGIREAASGFQSLADRLAAGDDAPYPGSLRMLVNVRLADARLESGELDAAGSAFERAAQEARRIEDGATVLDAYAKASAAFRRVGKLDRILSMLDEAVSSEAIPAAAKAKLYVQRAQLAYDLGDSRGALEPVTQAVRIWRLRSLDIPDKTARLVSTQMLGLHLLVDLDESDEARQWLGRIRSTLARVTEEDMTAAQHARFVAESDLESAALMVDQGRWNHARKNLTDVAHREAADGLHFSDQDDRTLFADRIVVLLAQVAIAQEQIGEAAELLNGFLKKSPLTDPVREKGRRNLLRDAALSMLESITDGTEIAETRRAIAESLDPEKQSDEALRALCGSEPIRAIRSRLARS